jgi:hypothetical protein
MLKAVAVPPARSYYFAAILLLSKAEPRDFNRLILIALSFARACA